MEYKGYAAGPIDFDPEDKTFSGSAHCANMSEKSRPSIITVGRGKKSHFDEHKQDKYFFRCVAASERSEEAANAAGAPAPAPRPLVPESELVARPHRRRFTAEYKRSILD
jgi:hypothetical protein